MASRLWKVTIGALLHDIGLLASRAGMDKGDSPSAGCSLISPYINDSDVLDSIRHHCPGDLPLAANAPAHLVSFAAGIASGMSGRISQEDQKNLYKPLGSVFYQLHGNPIRQVLPPRVLAEHPDETSLDGHASKADYEALLQSFVKSMGVLPSEESATSTLMEIMEACLSNVPALASQDGTADISLFDHAKLTAAYASCLLRWAEAENITDYARWMENREVEFYGQALFLLISIDLSGIQPFLYDIATKDALKSLRARSFYLELLLENTVDELVEAAGVTRANVLYAGGGHAYLLFPNTGLVKKSITDAIGKINRALFQLYGTRLFFALGLQEASASEFLGMKGPEAYSALFRSVSSQIAQNKLRRFSPENIRTLNHVDGPDTGRECIICGVPMQGTEDGVCPVCGAFSDISGKLLKPEALFAVMSRNVLPQSLPLFDRYGNRQYMHVLDETETLEYERTSPGLLARVYGKNRLIPGTAMPVTKLWMGDFAARNQDGSQKTLEEIAAQARGIGRIAVLRADVDNLGVAFVSGYPAQYRTLSRTSAFSRRLNLFFKHYINDLLVHPSFCIHDQAPAGNLTIVYSGGDDVFLIGAWDDVLAAAVDLRDSLVSYSEGTLSLSAGIAVVDAKEPIATVARTAGELEDAAKCHVHEDGIKDSIALFGFEVSQNKLVCHHLYSWKEFREKVIREKTDAISNVMTTCNHLGTAYLYNLLGLLRAAEGDRLNIARLAYLLARREPDRKKQPGAYAAYSKFSRDVYHWSLDSGNRQQLITALTIYAYTQRGDKEE